jgi:hypothetical protein
MSNTEKYFAGLETVEDIKAHYRQLAKENHPDLGGDPETMKEINRQYHEALKARDGQQSDGHAYKYKPDIEDELMAKLHELLKLRSLDIALIGYWIWVTGDTKRNKEALKAAGLQWHSKRKCWYYKPKGWKRSYHSNADLSELASKYGYKGFQTAEEEYMPAKRKGE